MRTLPSIFGVSRRNRLAGAAAPHCTALIVLAMCTNRHDRIGGRRAVAAVESDLEVFTGAADLAAVQRFTTGFAVRHEPTPLWCGRPTTGTTNCRDAHLRGLGAADDSAPEAGVDDGRRLQKRRMSPGSRQFEQ